MLFITQNTLNPDPCHLTPIQLPPLNKYPLEELLQTCGYLAAYLGTLIEGELLLLTTALTAKMGYMNFYGAMGMAFLGAYTRDWLTFLLARKSGQAIIDKKPSLKKKLAKVSGLMEKHPTLILIAYRQLYGFVTIIVLMAGISGVSMKKFGILSAISNALWVTIIGGLGYFCAEVMIRNLELVGSYKEYIIGFLGIAGLLYWFFKKRKEIRDDGNLLTGH